MVSLVEEEEESRRERPLPQFKFQGSMLCFDGHNWEESAGIFGRAAAEEEDATRQREEAGSRATGEQIRHGRRGNYGRLTGESSSSSVEDGRSGGRGFSDGRRRKKPLPWEPTAG
ncbi:hypothetical protein GW17_00056370 [Ensete ventricosum]|nr:hypothetical protein GW17_00056370 [Ensete ventricosum]